MRAGEIDQRPVQMRGRQSHDRPCRGHRHFGEGAVEPEGRVLKDVVGVVPAADGGKPAEHPVGEEPQSLRTEFENPAAGREIPFRQPRQAGGEGG